MRDRDGGFSLVELLVVMIIVGLLAGIAIPVFRGQQKRAGDASAQTDVTVIGKDLAAYYVDGTAATTVSGGSGSFAISDGTGTVDSGRLLAGNAASGAGSGTSTWCAQVTNALSGNTWRYSAASGLAQGSC